MRFRPRAYMCTALIVASVGCSEIRETAPERTANEQLLISTAADRAIDRLTFGVPVDGRAFLETKHFASYDSAYVIGGIRQKMAREGVHLVESPDQAAFIVEIRSGALSINQRRDYVGIGGFEMPIPLSDAVQLPMASLYEEDTHTGLAKFIVTTYDAETRDFLHSSGPVFGISWIDESTLVGIGWRDTNVVPEKFENQPRPPRMGQYRIDLQSW